MTTSELLQALRDIEGDVDDIPRQIAGSAQKNLGVLIERIEKEGVQPETAT